MISKIFNLYSVNSHDEDVLLFWQKKIFKAMSVSLLGIGVIPYILSCLYAVKTSEWHLIFGYTIIYCLGFCVAFMERLPFKIRVWTALFIIYALGVLSLSTTGLAGSARMYLFCFSAFGAIFAGLFGGLFTLAVNIATLTVFGFIFSSDFSQLHQTRGLAEPAEWFVIICTFAFICAAINISLCVLIKALEIYGKEFRLLIKNSRDIIWTMDENANVTFINAAVMSVFGYDQKDWVGLPLNRFLNQDGGKRLKNYLDNKVDAFSFESVIIRKDGDPVHVNISGNLLSHFSDSTNTYQGIIRDITQAKAEEKKQQELKDQLIQAEKLKTLGILAGSVAHDLNNILSGIATYPDVLLMDAKIQPSIAKGLRIIKESGQKASDVVSDLLTISRGSNSEKETININNVLKRYTRAPDFTKIKNSYPGVTIETMMEPELLNIDGSYIHIEKTIMNLVLNAVEEVSSRPGGYVTIATANTYLDSVIPGYENRAQGEYVVLSVSDNGSGISEEDQKKIFDPFYTRKEMGKSGTGLGLTVVWNAVQDHNGFVDIESGPEGTTFDLIFPATRKEAPKKTDPGSLDEIMGKGQMILIVDDREDQQAIAAGILESLGYRSKAVSNGYDAVEFIKKTPTDLVILDMIMAPSISGLETFRLIKKINPGQKAIIASGYAESEDVQTAQDLGAGSFVKKPYTILDMGIAIKEELDK